jgi:hypothetical protein
MPHAEADRDPLHRVAKLVRGHRLGKHLGVAHVVRPWNCGPAGGGGAGGEAGRVWALTIAAAAKVASEKNL